MSILMNNNNTIILCVVKLKIDFLFFSCVGKYFDRATPLYTTVVTDSARRVPQSALAYEKLETGKNRPIGNFHTRIATSFTQNFPY